MAFRATTYRPFDETFPEGVKLLLAANVVVYVVQQLAPPWFTPLFGLRPADVLGELRLWQPVTYMFLHGGLLHVLFNLLILWMMGGEVERFWGKREFLKYYFVCGLGAVALAFVFAYDGLVIGASGAIFGVMVAFGLLFPDRTIYVWFVLPVPAKYLVLILFAIELLVIGRGDGVAHFAHVGGAITGFLYMRFGWRDRLDLGGVSRRWRRRHLTLHAGGRQAADEAEIDRILDKISKSGLQSLTPEESRVLNEASRKFRQGQ
jgi:membrane associated rhomboid family serine protease